MQMETQTQRRLAVKMDERAAVHSKHEELLASVDGGNLSEVQRKQAADYIRDMELLDEEVDQLSAQAEADKKAQEKADAVRRAQRVSSGVTDQDEDGHTIYRTMAQFARDVLLTAPGREASKIRTGSGLGSDEIQRAEQRMELAKRTPATTLTSDLAGINPPQHIAQIFQVINTQRDLVNAAGNRVALDKGTVTYPQVDATPVVAVQATQKTEAGNTGMDISMVTKTASTYLGGGNLSWQAINWSSPNALDLWFRYAAADYALKTETDAATVVSASAFLNNIASPISGTPSFAQLMTAIAAGGGDVYANSGRMANAVIMAPDRYWFALGLTTDASLAFGNGGSLAVDPEGRRLRVIVSRGLNSGEIIVGDMDGLLVAETPGAPVEMRVVEPAIGGVEVGIIGAFEAAVVDDGAFALITTAS
jgi:hypothetical protein